jgi:hypothetical protein
MDANDPRIPQFTFKPGPTKDDYRGSQTNRRELDRKTGTIESREEAQRRYRELGLSTPDRDDGALDE